MELRVDLHVHSCLSPCASLAMSPRLIARQARRVGLDAVALTDHNSALDCPAFAECAAAEGIVALYGLEATSREEAHILCLFASLEPALELGAWIYARLPRWPNAPESLGDQVYVDAEDTVVGSVDKALLAAAEASAEEIARRAVGLGGLAVPAHVDRAAFSLLSQLGFLPDGPWAAVETVAVPPSVDIRGYALVTSSDAHRSEELGRGFSVLDCRERSAPSVLDALRQRRILRLHPR